MPTFRYVAVDPSGHRLVGEMSEADEQSVLDHLRQLNRFPTEVVLVDKAATNGARPGRGRGIPSRDLAVFSRQLSNLVRGGLPLLRSFNALIEHSENPRLRAVLTDVRDAIQAGSSLWEALGEHPQIFPPLFVNMVRAGEASGELQSILLWLADLMEADQQKRTQIRSALAYPALLVIVGSSAVFFLVTFLIPRFVGLFEEMDQALPLATVVLLTVSSFLGKWWWAVLAGATAAIGMSRLYVATPKGRFFWDTIKLRLPAFGKLSVKIGVARMARTLSTLLRGGVPILTALEVVRDVIGNERLARGIDDVRDKVREGQSIAEPLRQSGLFPPLLTHMIAVGEESAELDSVLMTVANSYDVEVENTIKALIALLEPVIIMTMGLIIGFIIAAMLLPVFQMNLFPT
ncbi:MAG: type II secretion system F family protein [Armatimonadetes bacterium]|nr:type II secretion system F family protein [Armatimonadota bacterium]